MSSLVVGLIKKGYLRTDSIIDAFLNVPRAEFVPKDLVSQAEADIALPIGHGQTISQPLTVACMLELLDPKADQNILDVGSGSGWTTGLLSYIVGKKGKVTALEVIEDLCEMGKKNVGKFNFISEGIAEFHCQSGEKGFEKNAPYDRILVSASLKEIPVEFKRQLSIGGKMVLPINNAIWCVEKKQEDDFMIKEFPGFMFVPFVSKL
jgi:protein-L-isoaspartate(D-aspartate) O-methyltransferase